MRLPAHPVSLRPRGEFFPGTRSARPRLLVYSHDSYGLGHLQRCVRIAAALAVRFTGLRTIIASGTPRPDCFRLPVGCELLSLPSITKDSVGAYVSGRRGTSLEEVLRIRTEALLGTARRFAPDLVLVDHAPVGVQRELIPTLHHLHRRSPRPALVLGLRDVIDSCDVVAQEWETHGVVSVLQDVYDRVLVYGDPTVLTTADELGLPDVMGQRLVYTGYLGVPDDTTDRAPGRDRRPLIVVTTGGGGDGREVVRAYVSYLQSQSGGGPFRSIIVTGPLMPGRDRRDVRDLERVLGDVRVLTFTPRLLSMLSSAAGAVSMGGYNTMVEILSRAVPALVMPRERPRREQRIRAERLTSRADVTLVGSDSQSSLSDFTERVTSRVPRRRPDVDLAGLSAVVAELAPLIDDEMPSASTAAPSAGHV